MRVSVYVRLYMCVCTCVCVGVCMSLPPPAPPNWNRMPPGIPLPMENWSEHGSRVLSFCKCVYCHLVSPYHNKKCLKILLGSIFSRIGKLGIVQFLCDCVEKCVSLRILYDTHGTQII
jgi:hypothetical protein